MTWKRAFAGVVVLTLAIAGVSLACQGTSAPQGADSPDASDRVEASVPVPPPPPPRPRDAAVDAEFDYDADRWEGTVPFPGEWKAIPGLPAQCSARIATTPSVSVSRFNWISCPSARDGCQYFLADWTPPTQGIFNIFNRSLTYEDADGVHLTYYRGIFSNSTDETRLSVVQQLEGDAELAIFADLSKNGCIPTSITSSPQGTTVVVSKRIVDFETFIGHADRPGLSSVTMSRLTPKLGSSKVIQGAARGDGFTAFEQTSGSLLITTSAYRISDETLIPASATEILETENPVPVPGGYYALVAATTPYVGFFPLTGTHAVVIRPLPGASIATFNVDQAEHTLIWYESTGGAWTVYTSPLAATEEGLTRRAVARFPAPRFRPVVNAGVLLIDSDAGSIRAIRMQDGLGWIVAGELGLPMLDGTWVNQTYVWSRLSIIPVGSPGYPTSGGMIRIKRSTLGQPTIPNGL